MIGLGIASIASGSSIAICLLRVPGSQLERPCAHPVACAKFSTSALRAWGSEMLIQLNLRVRLILVGAQPRASRQRASTRSRSRRLGSSACLVMTAISISALPRSARLGAHSELGLLERAERDALMRRTIRHAVLLAIYPPIALAIVALLAIGIPLFLMALPSTAPLPLA